MYVCVVNQVSSVQIMVDEFYLQICYLYCHELASWFIDIDERRTITVVTSILDY